MRTHLSHTGKPPFPSGIDPAITQAVEAIDRTMYLLNVMMSDTAAPARKLAIQLHGRDLLRSKAALRDLGVRSAR